MATIAETIPAPGDLCVTPVQRLCHRYVTDRGVKRCHKKIRARGRLDSVAKRIMQTVLIDPTKSDPSRRHKISAMKILESSQRATHGRSLGDEEKDRDLTDEAKLARNDRPGWP